MYATFRIDGVEVKLCAGANVATRWSERAGEWGNLTDDDFGQCLPSKDQQGDNESRVFEHFYHCRTFS